LSVWLVKERFPSGKTAYHTHPHGRVKTRKALIQAGAEWLARRKKNAA
jgi:hypothetical protein